VLLVEDNPVNQRVACAMLERIGVSVQVAADGRAGIEAAAADDFDAILMDCFMPEVDGFEATRAIRAREEAEGTARTPILAMTANAMRGDRERCIAAGMDDYLSKPVTKAELRNTLARWIGATA
jgi:CheY-like chemotaxis protein